MNAVSEFKVIKQVNTCSAKILREGSVSDFEANRFSLEHTNYPEIEGETWTLSIVQMKKVPDDKVENRTITIVVPYSAEDGNFPITDTNKRIYFDFVDSSDSEPYIHVAEKGSVNLTFERKGAEVSTISGRFDVTVSDYNVPSFQISGSLYYSK